MPFMKFEKGDTLIMKKKHPCSCDQFTVLRTGSDIRIACKGCGRDLTLERVALEKNVKKIIGPNGIEKKDG